MALPLTIEPGSTYGILFLRHKRIHFMSNEMDSNRVFYEASSGGFLIKTPVKQEFSFCSRKLYNDGGLCGYNSLIQS